jgi:hypothetical protein
MPTPAPAGPWVLDKHLLDLLQTGMSTREKGWWPVPKDVVTVNQVAPVAAAFSWSMAPVPSLTAPTSLEMTQAVRGAGELMAVEAWEVTP